MGLEAAAPGQLEIDLVLEQDRRLAHEIGDRLAQAALGIKRAQALVKRGQVLDALHHAAARLGEAILVIDHVPARHFRPGGDLVDPFGDSVGLGGIDKAGHMEESVPVKGGDPVVGQ